MISVLVVQPLPRYMLKLTFEDGLVATVHIRSHIGKGFTAELLDPTKFAEVTTEPGGGIMWPNGFDVCPEFLRGLAEKR
jgi:hypothetical protein